MTMALRTCSSTLKPCMRSGVQISHTDENGDTACYKCAAGECFRRFIDPPLGGTDQFNGLIIDWPLMHPILVQAIAVASQVGSVLCLGYNYIVTSHVLLG